MLTSLYGTKVYANANSSDDSTVRKWTENGDYTNNDGTKMIAIDSSQYGVHMFSDVTVKVQNMTTYKTRTPNVDTQSTITMIY